MSIVLSFICLLWYTYVCRYFCVYVCLYAIICLFYIYIIFQFYGCFAHYFSASWLASSIFLLLIIVICCSCIFLLLNFLKFILLLLQRIWFYCRFYNLLIKQFKHFPSTTVCLYALQMYNNVFKEEQIYKVPIH